MKKIALILITGYRWFLSPVFGGHCRFLPSCSEYTYEAISRYGLVKGAYLGCKRLFRCHPFGRGGVDPVP